MNGGIILAVVGLVRQILAIDWAARRKARKEARAERERAAKHKEVLDLVDRVIKKTEKPRAK